jgi:hypothetical protein
MSDKDFKNALDAVLGSDGNEDAKAKLALLKQLNQVLGEVAGESKEKKAPRPQPKVVRDSFTLPEDDYNLMLGFQDKAMDFRIRATKGEILRAGLHALQKMDDSTFIETLKGVEKLKPGRRKES